MANELTGTELAAIIPEVWRAEILMARYSAAVGDKVAYTEFPEIKSKGDIVHLAVFPRLSVNAVGAAGGVTNQSITLTDNSITINNHMEATVQILDSAGWQSLFGDPKVLAQKFAAQFGPRLAERQDNDLFALYASLTTTAVGATGAEAVAMSSQALMLAQQRLDTARVPKSDRNLVMAPKAHWELFSEDKFALAYATGLKMGAQIAGPDVVPSLFGVKYHTSPEIAAAASANRNLLLHKEAMALVTQKNISIVPLAKTDLTTRITGHVLYDVAVIRGDHGVEIRSVT